MLMIIIDLFFTRNCLFIYFFLERIFLKRNFTNIQQITLITRDILIKKY